MIEKLVTSLFSSPQETSWQAYLVTIAVIVLVKHKDILEFLGRKGKRREEVIKEALNNDATTGASRWAVEEEWNRLVFREVHGISADRVLREKIRQLVDKAGGELQPAQLARAERFLRIRDGKLLIETDKTDKAEYVFNWVFVTYLGGVSLLCFWLPTSVSKPTVELFLQLYGMGASLVCLALYVTAQNFPFAIAKRIAPMIHRLQVEQEPDEQ